MSASIFKHTKKKNLFNWKNQIVWISFWFYWWVWKTPHSDGLLKWIICEFKKKKKLHIHSIPEAASRKRYNIVPKSSIELDLFRLNCFNDNNLIGINGILFTIRWFYVMLNAPTARFVHGQNLFCLGILLRFIHPIGNEIFFLLLLLFKSNH